MSLVGSLLATVAGFLRCRGAAELEGSVEPEYSRLAVLGRSGCR